MNLIKLVKTSCVLLLCTLLSNITFAQLNASFTANTTSGCAPLFVAFTNQSTGGATSYNWNFHDPYSTNTVLIANPTHIFSRPGNYTITLTIANASGIDSVVRVDYIVVYAQPTVSISASTQTGCVGTNIQFTNASTPGSGTIASSFWEFGDGGTSSSLNPSHIYQSAGPFNVSLLVTNSFGCSSSLTMNHFVDITPKPVANFTLGSTANCGAPFTATFNNTSTGVGPLTYIWNFGDGRTDTTRNPSHTYNTSGSFTVTLTVTNQNGCSSVKTIANALTIANNYTMFNIPTSVCVNTPVTITNLTTPNPVSLNWNFGDGSSSTSFNPTKSYDTPGVFTITLVNNYGGCIDSIRKVINVLRQPNANFTASPVSSCYAPLVVNFTNPNTASGNTYHWDFGDGDTSNLANPVHTYQRQGNFSVTLTVTNAAGCSRTITMSNYINIQLPVVSIKDLPQKGCAPLVWHFEHEILGGDSIVSFSWYFGDGSPVSHEVSPTHTYDSTGNYTVTLSVITLSGCRDSVTYLAGIRVGVRPHAAFTANILTTCAETPIRFTDLSTPRLQISEWYWDFGDHSTSTTQNPMHTYQDTGYFDVQLIAYNNGCPDTIIIPQYIHIFPPIAKFTVLGNCRERMIKKFKNTSIGADSWTWDFGDGTSDTAYSPTHTYATSGIYTVKLIVHNNTSGCNYTKTAIVYVVNQRATISATDTIICRSTSVTFTATNINPALFNSYGWNFGDNTSGSGNPITKTYFIPGYYCTRLITTDRNGCKDTIGNKCVRVYGPTARAGMHVTDACSGSNVTFRDSSTSDGVNPIVQWIWNFGDGTIDTVSTRTVQHSYPLGGVYHIVLTAIDSRGCSHLDSSSAPITIHHPSSSFTTFDSVSCPAHAVTFNNTSTGIGLSYHWNFGDFQTSTATNPNHSYNNVGQYSVTLVAQDQYGCRDTSTRSNYISIVVPNVRFTVSDSVGNCPPLIVTFVNQSTNVSSLNWNFGDGTGASALDTLSHFYSESGTFNSQLTVTGPGGCTASQIIPIRLHGPGGSFTYGGLMGCAPYNVNFSATTRNTNFYTWDFSDGYSIIDTTSTNATHTYNNAGDFIPQLILKDSAGCTVTKTGTQVIKVYDLHAGFDFVSSSVCDRGTVTFSNTSYSTDIINSYTWNFDDGSPTVNTSNASHTYNNPGSYHPLLITTSIHGCIDTIINSIPVNIVSTPRAAISQTANGCVDLSVNFSGSLLNTDTSRMTWHWNFGNGNTSDSLSPASQVYNIPGIHPIELLVTNSSGCSDTVHSTVEAYAIPVINAGADSVICKGSSITLNATGGLSYQWTPAIALNCTDCANPIASPINPVVYHLSGTSAQGCVGKDSVSITIKYPFNMTGSNKDSLCKGSSVRIFATGAHSYQWSPSAGLDNPNSSAPMATPDHSTIYQVIGTDDKHCFYDTTYVPIVVFNVPTVEAGADRTINVGQSAELTPDISNDVIDVRWTPTGAITRVIYPGVIVKPRITTQYTVSVKNRGGCVATDHLTVNVLCNDANLFVPNTFSPNNDGMNDVFYPRGSGVFTIKSFKIFSRWGEVIFEKNNFNANDASKGWDGTFKGRQLNSDVFVYVVEVICDDNQTLTFKGNIAIIK